MKNLLWLLSIFILAGCQKRPQMMLLINGSPSSYPVIHCKEANQKINKVIYRAKPNELPVAVIAKRHLFLLLPTRQLDATRLWQTIEKARREQRQFDPLTLKERDASKKNKKIAAWGWGTCHAEGFRRLAEQRKPGYCAIIVVLTDGFNEDYQWEDVQAALKELFDKGSTRLVILGLSQRIVDESQQLSVLGLWRKSLIKLGAEDLIINPKAQRGFFANSSLEFPGWLLEGF